MPTKPKWVMYYTLIKNKDIVLDQAENASAPTRAKNTAIDVDTQNIEITKQFKLLLNRLSEEHLAHVTDKIRQLPMKKYWKL